MRYLRIVEQEEAERIRKIKLVQTKSEKLRHERIEVEDENTLRQQRRLE